MGRGLESGGRAIASGSLQSGVPMPRRSGVNAFSNT